MKTVISALSALCLAWAGAATAAGTRGLHFGRTGIGVGSLILDDLVPDGIATGRSRPWAVWLSQEFYRGAGMRLGLTGNWAWGKAQESCFGLGCMDFSTSGRYYWDTRHASIALRVGPDREGFLGGFGAEAGYIRFLYHWGVSREGWDSRFPDGYFLAGDYDSHQAFLGTDYSWSFRKACWGFAVSAGLRQAIATRNTFTPKRLHGAPETVPFSEWPLSSHFALKLEL